MKTSITASLDFINIELWKEFVRKYMNELFKKAAGEFLVTAVPKIPIWTGHARSAFKNLEDIAGKVVAAKDYTRGVRVRTDRKGGKQVRVLRNEYYYPPGGGRVKKTTQSGRDFATDPSAIINTTGVKLASGRVAFYFKFEIDITYFNFLDRDHWHSFEEGTKVFEEYIRTNIDLSDIDKFLLRKRVT